MTTTGRELQGYEAPGLLEPIRELEDRFALAVRQRDLLADYITKRMQPGKHFYKVADGQKPSLTKEGGELICLPHGYKPMYFQEGGPKEPADDDVPYQITVKCRLMKGELFEGEGMGSASSHITRKDGARIVRMRDVGLRHNATLKIASKSAYIAATLNATAASEFFTQDMEDGEGPDSITEPSGSARDRQLFCPEHKVELAHRKGVSKVGKAYDGYFCPARDCKHVVWTDSLEESDLKGQGIYHSARETIKTENESKAMPQGPFRDGMESDEGQAPSGALVEIFNRLKAIMEKYGVKVEAVKNRYKVSSLANLSEKQASDCIKWIEDYAQAKGQG